MKKVVIIDDEEQITSMLRKALSRNPEFAVSTYNNPIVAIQEMASAWPDIVLLDIMMPQMDGIAALENIKKRSPATKVMMMTAYSTLDRVLESHKLGAASYILKPFESLADVEQKIRQILAAEG